MNVSKGNRKLKAYNTGYATIRETTEGYIIIGLFEDWNKSHALDPHNVKPGTVGKAYDSFKDALNASKKYFPNLIIRRALKKPLATSDFYSNLLIDKKDVIY